jgi:outer membrane protein OmpA-like peptidoglycan-associated protein
MKTLAVTIILSTVAAVSAAQTQPVVPVVAPSSEVSRTTKAVHYRIQGGSVKIDFQGTELLPHATGEAKVDGKKTTMEIEARFQGVEDATVFGMEYLTYVLWAVSPQGRAVNLGEVSLEKGGGHLKAFTDLQTFGLIVTAEPYFAVTQPGNMVVLENLVREGEMAEAIDAKYELLGRGTYGSANTHIQDAIFGIDPRTPLELFEARNAVRIAHIAAGDKYGSTILGKADQQLRQAEDAYRGHQNRQAIEAVAKEATETSEEARVMAVKQKAEDDAKAEAEAKEAQARAQVEAEAKRRAEAEAARAEAERLKQEAEKAAQEAAQQKEEAEKAKAEALAQQQALAAEAEKAKAAAQQSEQLRQQAENEKQELRARLLKQLNTILATRDTARGLIANMSDVLFKSGSAELLPTARERLAKVSGIVLAYPGLHLAVEGHTDSIGGDDYNQSLSERRAQAVRAYLVQQGTAADAIEARGLGKSDPVASNDTPEGRQQNRRVELVLSGDAIGSTAEDGKAQIVPTKLDQ